MLRTRDRLGRGAVLAVPHAGGAAVAAELLDFLAQGAWAGRGRHLDDFGEGAGDGWLFGVVAALAVVLFASARGDGAEGGEGFVVV